MKTNDLTTALAMSPPAVILVRHAEKAPKERGEDRDRLLTSDGMQKALAMGKEIGLAGRPATIWHSPVPRCCQTARQIADGAGIGGICEYPRLEGIPDFVADNNVKEQAIRREKRRGGGRSFKDVVDILAKNDGYPGFPRPSLGAIMLTNLLLARAAEGININVSHDWIIYLIAFFAQTETFPFTERRPEFLEFLSLQKGENDAIKVCYRGKNGILAPRIG